MSATDPLILRERLREADEAQMVRALAAADPLALLAATYQLTGDERLLGVGRAAVVGDSWERPRPPEIGGPADLERLRAIALAMLQDLRDAESTTVGPPTQERFQKAAELMFDEEIPEGEVPWWWEEFAVTALPRAVDPVQPAGSEPFRVLVIGAGMNGLTAAVVLQAAGIEFTVADKEPGVGGTWQRNAYPGARVDVESRSYSFSYEPDYHWDHHYALRDELQSYFQYVTDKYQLGEHLRLETAVELAQWNEEAGAWDVTLCPAGGEPQSERFHAIISAVGLFNRPNYPNIEGLEDFKGRIMHTTQWDHSYDVAGKRVALIGTGASGTQLVAAIAPEVASLKIFQRAGSWVSNLAGYTDRIPEEEHWLIDHVPYYVNWVRVLTTYSIGDKRIGIYDVDQSWDDPDSVSAINAKIRATLVEHLENKLADRPDLIEKCIPKFPAMAKRLPKDNGWFQALTRDNVELVVDPIDRVVEHGVRTVTGIEREVDLIILATGFRPNDFLWPMYIEGIDGLTLEEAWKEDGARAYLGITVPGFPNLFCMYGPNTNPMSGGICSWGEMQARYIVKCVKYLIEEDRRSLTVRDEVCRTFNQELDRRLAHTVWMDQRQTSYYRNEFNRSGTQAPWATLEYWRMTLDPALDDYVVL